MVNPRYKPVLLTLPALLLVWLLAWAGSSAALSTKMTAEKIKQFVSGVDLAGTTPAQRVERLRELQTRVDALPPREWEKWSAAPDNERWFAHMTWGEKAMYDNTSMLSNFNWLITNMRPQRRRQGK